jgi:hypothetical protein
LSNKITKPQIERLSRELLKDYKKLNRPIETLTKEEAKELILHFEKRYRLKDTESLIEPMTAKEFSENTLPIYTKAEVADLLQTIADRYKIINSDIIRNAVKVYKIKEIDQEKEDNFYHSIQTVKFLREKLKSWDEFEKVLYYLDRDKFTMFKNMEEFQQKREEWGLPNKQLFIWKKYKECIIIGYDQYNRAILQLKRETTLLQAVNVDWFKTFNKD